MNLSQPITILRTFDETKSREFYVDYLGFTIDWEHRFAKDMPLYMQVSKDNCVLHLSEHHGDGTPGTIIRIECTDIKGYHRELQSKNYASLNPGINDTPWSKMELSLADPFGNKLIFFEPRD
ncbi:MAG: glyoxalase superfamily protein [Bacteroidota bacterium]